MASEQPNNQTNQPELPPGLLRYPTQASSWPENGAERGSVGSDVGFAASSSSSSETTTGFRAATSVERLTSGAIDVVVLGIAGLVYIEKFGTTTTPTPSSPNSGKTIGGTAMLWFIALSLAYFFLMELYLGGSIGKVALGQRVQSLNQNKPTPKQLAIRTILRPIDGLPYFIPNLVGFLVLQSGDKRQRLGDRYAGTVVVKNR
jgi:uncharacterized RDD family membrane protein YckC